MIFTIIPKNKFGASEEYTLGLHITGEDRRCPKILHGKLEVFRALKEVAKKSENPTTAMALSTEEQLAQDLELKIIKGFLCVVFPGLEESDYNALVVHHDERGLEPGTTSTGIHFLINNIYLKSGNFLQPYYDGDHRALFESYVEITNYLYGLSSGKDPNRVSPIRIWNEGTLPEIVNAKIEILNEVRKDQILESIDSQEKMVEWLEKSGHQVVETGERHIRIKYEGKNTEIILSGPLCAQGKYRVSLSECAERAIREARESGRGERHYQSVLRRNFRHMPAYDETIGLYRERFTKEFQRSYKKHQQRGKTGPMADWIVHYCDPNLHEYFTPEFLDQCRREASKPDLQPLSEPGKHCDISVDPEKGEHRRGDQSERDSLHDHGGGESDTPDDVYWSDISHPHKRRKLDTGSETRRGLFHQNSGALHKGIEYGYNTNNSTGRLIDRAHRWIHRVANDDAENDKQATTGNRAADEYLQYAEQNHRRIVECHQQAERDLEQAERDYAQATDWLGKLGDKFAGVTKWVASARIKAGKGLGVFAGAIGSSFECIQRAFENGFVKRWMKRQKLKKLKPIDLPRVGEDRDKNMGRGD